MCNFPTLPQSTSILSDKSRSWSISFFSGTTKPLVRKLGWNSWVIFGSKSEAVKNQNKTYRGVRLSGKNATFYWKNCPLSISVC